MNSAKPILTSLFLILTFVLSAQTYTKLSDGSTIPPGKSYYILPKGSFIIEIPIVTSKLIKGAMYNKDFNEDILKFANEKIVFNAGLRGFSVAIKSEDYKNLEKPEVVELCD